MAKQGMQYMSKVYHQKQDASKGKIREIKTKQSTKNLKN